jgi:hypothetical protein
MVAPIFAQPVDGEMTAVVITGGSKNPDNVLRSVVTAVDNKVPRDVKKEQETGSMPAANAASQSLGTYTWEWM